MKFKGELDTSAQEQVNRNNNFLLDPQRLEAVKNTGLMGTPREQSFDRLAFLAAQILKVPLTIISLIDDKTHFFKAAYGLQAPMDEIRQISIEGSICRYIMSGEEIITSDARVNNLLAYHPATTPWNIVGFITLPLKTQEGYVLGTFCAVDSKIRNWSDEEINIMRELTVSVMTEINLREQIKKLNIEKTLRETFVATLTHDLRTPLAASKMTAQLIQRRYPDTKELQRFSRRIDENIDRADRMIQNLLDASQINSGEVVPLQKRLCSMNEIIELAIENLTMVHGERFVLQTTTRLEGYWDDQAITRLIENLSVNAIKYGSHDTQVTISIHKIQSNVIISVHNYGYPIPEADQPNLFELFHRSQSAVGGKAQGWGLGLALVKGLAEAHGGSVSLVSNPEQGTTFSVTLPH